VTVGDREQEARQSWRRPTNSLSPTSIIITVPNSLITPPNCRKIVVVGDQINGKKERSRKLNKTVNINAADILSNIAAKKYLTPSQLITLKCWCGCYSTKSK